MWLKTNFWWLGLVVVGLLVVWWVFWPMLKKDKEAEQLKVKLAEKDQLIESIAKRESRYHDSMLLFRGRWLEQKAITQQIKSERKAIQYLYRDMHGDQLQREFAAAADSLRRQRLRESGGN